MRKSDVVSCRDIKDAAVTTLKNIRNDENFDLFWETVLQNDKRLGVDDPKLPKNNRASQS